MNLKNSVERIDKGNKKCIWKKKQVTEKKSQKKVTENIWKVRRIKPFPS